MADDAPAQIDAANDGVVAIGGDQVAVGGDDHVPQAAKAGPGRRHAIGERAYCAAPGDRADQARRRIDAANAAIVGIDDVEIAFEVQIDGQRRRQGGIHRRSIVPREALAPRAGDGGNDARAAVYPAHAVAARIGDEEVAGGVETAAVAGPPSPISPRPPPATVAMVPSPRSTARTR